MVRWPLRYNVIRRHSANNTFGKVRNNKTKNHQGWDLYAIPGTKCFAIADGEIVFADTRGHLGELVVLKFDFRGTTRYAAYAHLNSFDVSRADKVVMGQWIGDTGNTGNATSMTGDDQHLHFEIRTIEMPGVGLDWRLDPVEIYGVVPLKAGITDNGPEIAPRSEVKIPHALGSSFRERQLQGASLSTVRPLSLFK